MKKEFDFIAKRKIFFTISIILIAVSILSSFIFGVDLDIQFKGGTIINYAYDGDIDVTEFTSKASEALDGITVNAATGTDFTSNRNSITLSLITKSGLTSEKQFDLTNTLTEAYADNNLDLISSSDVSPSAGSEFFKKCLVAVGFASVVLIIYIAFRFKKISGWSAGVIAVIALLHDIIVTYGTFVICRMEIDANFMAVVLTILGYSINNTIVIYDRIRENERLYGKKRVGDVRNAEALRTREVIVRAALRHVQPAGHAVVDHGGEEGRGQQRLVHFFHLRHARDHAAGKIVDLLCVGCLQLLKGLVGGQVAEIEARFFTGQLIDAVIQRQLQCFEKVEHGSVAPRERVALGRQLHAAHDRVVHRVLLMHAVRLQRGDDRLVIEDLRHPAAKRDDTRGSFQKRLRRIFVDAQRQIGLRQQQVRLRPQKQIAQLVGGVRAVELLSADGNVEADREAGEVLGAVGIAQIHKLVELQPQAFRDLQRVLQRHAARAAVGEIRIQILIHPPG